MDNSAAPAVSSIFLLRVTRGQSNGGSASALTASDTLYIARARSVGITLDVAPVPPTTYLDDKPKPPSSKAPASPA